MMKQVFLNFLASVILSTDFFFNRSIAFEK